MDLDAVTPSLEPTDDALHGGLFVLALEVVRAEVLVSGLVLKDVVDDEEDRVSKGDEGTLPAASGGEAAVVGAEVGVLGV